MTDFWQSSGYDLLAVGVDGKLRLGDDFLRAYFARPEVRPVAESCAAERALHARLTDDPRLAVSARQLEALEDRDARDNYAAVLRLRDHLVRFETLEAAYMALFQGAPIALPPLFLDQLAHVLLRHILDGCGDPIRVRAAEAFFRAQRVSLKDGAILLADEETVEMHAKTGGFGAIGQLLGETGTAMRTIDLDILDDANGALYWDRSDRFDTVLDATFTRPGLDALCRVVEAWVAHFLGAAISVQPVPAMEDARWVVGLDAESTAILNDLYNGEEVGEDRLARLLALFRLEFREPSLMLPHVAGRPVYLGMAMTPGGVLRLKPQNLLCNLPLAAGA